MLLGGYRRSWQDDFWKLRWRCGMDFRFFRRRVLFPKRRAWEDPSHPHVQRYHGPWNLETHEKIFNSSSFRHYWGSWRWKEGNRAVCWVYRWKPKEWYAGENPSWSPRAHHHFCQRKSQVWETMQNDLSKIWKDLCWIPWWKVPRSSTKHHSKI